MPAKPKSYGAAQAAARAMLAEARLADPDEHYPYKAADVDALLADNPPMGPGGQKDSTARAEDFMSQRIADASAAYIEAQAAVVADPSRANRTAYEAAKDDLAAARRTHRRGRVDANGAPVGAVVASTGGALPEHMVGPRLRRVGEE
jgi:hypothetical protein